MNGSAVEDVKQEQGNGQLGPSVMPDFPDAPTLDELAAAPDDTIRQQRSEDGAAPAAPPPAAISGEVLAKTVQQIDHTVSTLLQVDTEDPEYIEQVADGLLPLANYYASQQPSVATLWIVAGLTMLSYATIKYQKVSAIHGSETADTEE